LKNLLVALLLSFSWLCSFSSQADEPPIIEHTIVDDGWVQIDLGFTFPLYDKTFITSFMFANGVVGFISPTEIPGTGIQNDGLCCNAYDFDNVDYANMGATYGGNYAGVRFDYLVAPWHTDLIDIGAGVFKTQGDSTFQSYFWENISEYYDPNDLNTFSTTLYPLGNINFTYQKLDIQEHKVSVFVSGDLSAGEYEQFFYNDPTNGGVYWTSGDSTPVDIAEGESICDVAPDSSLVCLWYPESYAGAYYDQQCGISSLYDSGCDGYTTAYYNQQCGLDALYDPNCSGYMTAYIDSQCLLDPLYSTSCAGWASAYAEETSEPEEEEYGVPEEEYEQTEVFEPENTYSESTDFDISFDFDVSDTNVPTFETDYQEYDVSFDDLMIEFEQEIQQEMETLFAEMDIDMEDMGETPIPEPIIEEMTDEPIEEPMEETTMEETMEEPETEPIEEETNEEEILDEENVEPEEEAEETDEGAEDEEADSSVEEEEVDESETEESEESEDEEPDEVAEDEEIDEPEPEEKEEVMVAKVEPKKMTAEEKKKARQKKMREIITNKLKNLAISMGEASSLQAQKDLQNIILALLNYNQGFASYNLQLTDVDFYDSRIIYPIRLPDSLRGRRIGLASELLHKQLVDIQWSEGYGRIRVQGN